MNRDCNIESLSYRTTDGGTVIRLSDLQDWMTDKKIIKKGLQPHPYADVLHEWLEDTTKEVEQYAGLGKYGDHVDMADRLCFVDDIRIKPSEPVYEWQWLAINKNNNSVRDFLNYQNYMTVLEASNHYVSKLDTRIYNIVKIEETKRVRNEKH